MVVMSDDKTAAWLEKLMVERMVGYSVEKMADAMAFWTVEKMAVLMVY